LKYFSDEFFREVEKILSDDPKWQADTKNVKTSILFSVTDQSSSNLLMVQDGKTSFTKPEPNAQAEFSFEGPYEVWARIGRGEIDLQAAVLKGHLKFRGSITKILYYKDRFIRIAEVIKTVPKEF
jgi:putative sterol carrier protein